jgi:hypothetical protein
LNNNIQPILSTNINILNTQQNLVPNNNNNDNNNDNNNNNNMGYVQYHQINPNTK